MNILKTSLLLLLIVILCVRVADAQEIDRKLMFWENRTIDIGTVLEENGPIEVEFLGLNQTDSIILISDIITDCGCTTAAYSKDSIFQGKIGSVRVNFTPDHKGGPFTKLIIVRTNQDIYGDTLYLQGFNIPFPEDVNTAYPFQNQDIGMRLSVINMGDVYTNEPKKKFVEVFNFGKDSLRLSQKPDSKPEYMGLELQPTSIATNQRGLLLIDYNGKMKNDFGLVQDELTLFFEKKEKPFKIALLANIFEYFEPTPKIMENIVPRLGISEIDIDLRNITSNDIVQKNIKLTNQGEELLQIRKVMTNCDCLSVFAEKESIGGGETVDLSFTFNPKGRRGIDHKHIMIFTNDPIQPVRTIVIRSMIK